MELDDGCQDSVGRGAGGFGGDGQAEGMDVAAGYRADRYKANLPALQACQRGSIEITQESPGDIRTRKRDIVDLAAAQVIENGVIRRDNVHL